MVTRTTCPESRTVPLMVTLSIAETESTGSSVRVGGLVSLPSTPVESEQATIHSGAKIRNGGQVLMIPH